MQKLQITQNNTKLRTVTKRFNSELKLHVDHRMMSSCRLDTSVQVKQLYVVWNRHKRQADYNFQAIFQANWG